MSNRKPNETGRFPWWPRRQQSPFGKAAGSVFQHNADKMLEDAVQTVYGVINGQIKLGPTNENTANYIASLNQNKTLVVNSILADGLLIALEENLQHEAKLAQLRQQYGDGAVAKAVARLQGYAPTGQPAQSTNEVTQVVEQPQTEQVVNIPTEHPMDSGDTNNNPGIAPTTTEVTK